MLCGADIARRSSLTPSRARGAAGSISVSNQSNQNNQNNTVKNKYVIIRTRSAGVFAGTLASFKDQVAILKNARRLWYWSGAASLSQLAVDGTSNPGACKFPTPVLSIILPEVIEIIPATKKAQESIANVSIWSA